MDHSYATDFRYFRDEYMRFKGSPFINHSPRVMGQEWLNPAICDGSGTPELGSYAASTSPSSSRQRTPQVSPPSSDSKSAIAREAPNAGEEAPNGTDGEGSEKPDHQVTKNGEPSASEAVLPPQRSRKGHKKSRQGCYNCKRRKIKVRIPNTGPLHVALY